MIIVYIILQIAPNYKIYFFLSLLLNQEFPKDCQEVKAYVSVASGQYMILPQNNGSSFPVYCDMDTDGGGWLVSMNNLFSNLQESSYNFEVSFTLVLWVKTYWYLVIH